MINDLAEIKAQLNNIETLLRASGDDFLTEEQVAAMLQVTPRYLKRLRAEGKITATYIGGGKDRAGAVRYTKHDIESFATRNRQ